MPPSLAGDHSVVVSVLHRAVGSESQVLRQGACAVLEPLPCPAHLHLLTMWSASHTQDMRRFHRLRRHCRRHCRRLRLLPTAIASTIANAVAAAVVASTIAIAASAIATAIAAAALAATAVTTTACTTAVVTGAAVADRSSHPLL